MLGPAAGVWLGLGALLPHVDTFLSDQTGGAEDFLRLAVGTSAAIGAMAACLAGLVLGALRGRWALIPVALAGPLHAGVGLALHGVMVTQAHLAKAALDRFLAPWTWVTTSWLWSEVHDFGTGVVAVVLTPFTFLVDVLILTVAALVGSVVASPRVLLVTLVWLAITGAVCGVVALVARGRNPPPEPADPA